MAKATPKDSTPKAEKAQPTPPAAVPVVAAADRGAAPAGFVWLTHAQIQPDPNNARKVFDADALAELADSMAVRGLLQKPAVRAAGEDGAHQLVAGERRWRACGALIADGRWPPEHPELCPIIEASDAEAEAAGLIENLQRRDLKPLEEARGFQRLIEVHGETAQTIANKVGFTVRMVQQRVQLLKLSRDDMADLDNGKIPIEEARRRLANYPVPLSAAARLLYAEVIEKAFADPVKTRDRWSPPKVEIRANISITPNNHGGKSIEYSVDDPALDELRKRGLVYPPEGISEPIGYSNVATGRAALRLPYAWDRDAKKPEVAGDLVTPGSRAKVLAKLRREAGGKPAEAATYLTSWLNGPFEPHPDLAADFAATKAAASNERAKEREKNKKLAQREAEARQERDRANTEMIETARAITSPQIGQLLQARIREAARGIGHPLPWSLKTDSEGRHHLLDAGGHGIQLDDWSQSFSSTALVMVAVNRLVDAPPNFGAPVGDATVAPHDEDTPAPGLLKLAGVRAKAADETVEA